MGRIANAKAYLVFRPTPIIHIFDPSGFFCSRLLKPYNADHGPYAAQRTKIQRFDSLAFNDGLFTEPVRPINGQLELNSTVLMQFLIYDMIVNRSTKLNPKRFSKFLEGNNRNNAERFFEHVATPLISGLPSGQIIGSLARYSIDHERKFNGALWDDLFLEYWAGRLELPKTTR